MRPIRRLNWFGDHARERWGGMVGKIMLHAGVACPNRSRGGCVYCSAESYAPYYLHAGDSVEDQLAQGKESLRHLGAERYFAGFQQETSTACRFEDVEARLMAPLRDADCVGLAVSTRPDCVSEPFLEAFARAAEPFPGKPVVIELGLQSSDDGMLARLNRNHTAADFAAAMRLLRRFPRFETGAHLILGLPGETLEQMRDSIRFACGHGAGHLKLHHLQVVRGTPLSASYAAEPFPLPSAGEYLDWLCGLIPWIPAGVVVHRLWSNCRPDLLEHPRWNIESARLHERLSRLLEERGIVQGEKTVL